MSNEEKLKEKKEILFYYESRQNPNGDPGFENQPRVMSDDRIMVTDVRIKRTMRDYAKRVLGEELFVDFGKDGNPVKADTRAKVIMNKKNEEDLNKIDVIEALLKLTFDVPLFGALVTIRSQGKGEGNSQKLTGPLQFGIARSINQVEVINPQISTRFVGREKMTKEQEVSTQQFSTLGRFYSVEYALIKVHGALNPQNLGKKYLEDNEIKEKFEYCCERIFECLWNGTNELVTRSKFPQRSILYLEITYNNTIYNDLPILVNERDDLKGKVTELGKSPFNFDKFLSAIKNRKGKIKEIRIKGSEDISSDINNIVQSSKSIFPIEKIE